LGGFGAGADVLGKSETVSFIARLITVGGEVIGLVMFNGFGVVSQRKSGSAAQAMSGGSTSTAIIRLRRLYFIRAV
jgi:hypothetical protein